MISLKSNKDCSGCFACYNACPKNCIEMLSDNEGFKYPSIDNAKCIDCGICEKICPILNKTVQPSLKEAYAVKNKDEDIRLKSSSGGVFTLLAQNIINQGGVVFGAAFSNDFSKVIHIAITNEVDIEKLRGSKYLQSEIGNTYKEAKNFLEEGRLVLYSGTPCQIAGLHSFLGKQYDNLFTQDIICHGVPSKLVWEKYLKALSKKRKGLENGSFRDKTNGWRTWSLFFKFKNFNYIKSSNKDLYAKGFIENLFLRPSCHDCNFKSLDRDSDITLADFWGIENILPDFDDNLGISLVFVNSQKGKKLFSNIEDFIDLKEVNIVDAIKNNPSAIKSSLPHIKREEFFEKLNEKNINLNIKKQLNGNFVVNLKRKGKYVFKKIIKRLFKKA